MQHLKLWRNGRKIMFACDEHEHSYICSWPLANAATLDRVLRRVVKAGTTSERSDTWRYATAGGDRWSAQLSREYDRHRYLTKLTLKHTLECLPQRYSDIRRNRKTPRVLDLRPQITLPTASFADECVLRDIAKPNVTLSSRLREQRYAFEQGVDQSRKIMQAVSAQYAKALREIAVDAATAAETDNANAVQLKRDAIRSFETAVLLLACKIIAYEPRPRRNDASRVAKAETRKRPQRSVRKASASQHATAASATIPTKKRRLRIPKCRGCGDCALRFVNRSAWSAHRKAQHPDKLVGRWYKAPRFESE